MKIILLKDIKGVGRKFDIKEVSSGYARNFLLPNKLATAADNESLKRLEDKKKIEEKQIEENKIENERIIKEINSKEIKIETKIGDEGQLFESISEQKISDRLKELGYNIEKSQIKIDNPIKHTGEFLVKVKLGDLEGEIKIII
ncbi:MAG: 50S ribosomal protein L9 [Candidatus Paceibacterota bacterium]|jgi:large subunit ribosomal protein L9